MGGRGLYLVPFALFLFLFFYFSRGKVYFNSLVGRLRDSSSAGQGMTYVSVLEAYNRFLWECGRILDVSKKSFIVYIPNIFFY